MRANPPGNRERRYPSAFRSYFIVCSVLSLLHPSHFLPLMTSFSHLMDDANATAPHPDASSERTVTGHFSQQVVSVSGRFSNVEETRPDGKSRKEKGEKNALVYYYAQVYCKKSISKQNGDSFSNFFHVCCFLCFFLSFSPRVGVTNHIYGPINLKVARSAIAHDLRYVRVSPPSQHCFSCRLSSIFLSLITCSFIFFKQSFQSLAAETSTIADQQKFLVNIVLFSSMTLVDDRVAGVVKGDCAFVYTSSSSNVEHSIKIYQSIAWTFSVVSSN